MKGCVLQVRLGSEMPCVVCVRSSHQRCSVRKGVLKNFAKFTGKHLCKSLFFNEVAGLRPATLLKKRLWHRCFPVNFAKFLRTPFLQNTSGRPLLMCVCVGWKRRVMRVLLWPDSKPWGECFNYQTGRQLP